MKLYIEQKVFSIGDKFRIMDAEGETRFTVEGQIFSLGKKLHIYDENHTEQAVLVQKLLTLLPKFELEVNGGQNCTISRKMALFRSAFETSYPQWKVTGNFTGHDYQFEGSNGTAASVHKKWMSWGDSYEVDIADEADALYVIGVVLAIDAVLEADNAAAASSASN